MPHQAFVAGVVLMDIHKRYILADEVGLGKTIEAGIVIHDLLSQKPDARVLIVCPGSLVQQWLSEIYSKFGGQIFRLIDIRTREQNPLKEAKKVIISTNLAVSRFPDELAAIKWDLVVIDEVHHLLASLPLYRLVSRLAAEVPSLLLLSAIPAQKREDEFLRLLALLEPGRYAPEDPVQREEFRALYAFQSDIGRRVRILARRIDEFETGDASAEEVIEICRRLLQMPVLKEDYQLKSMIENLTMGAPGLVPDARRALRYVADKYRINRRILRNRRQQLIDKGQIHSIKRKCVPSPYQPDQLEIDCADSVETLLSGALRKGIEPNILVPFARTIFQSMASPYSLADLLLCLKESRPQKLKEWFGDPTSSGELTGYTEWEAYRDHLCSCARVYLNDVELDQALEPTLVWAKYSGGSKRLRKLFEYLKFKARETQLPKLIIFAGFPGIAAPLAAELLRAFGEGSISVFLSGLTREEKEENVMKFQADPRIFLMVSDETGGEGRNFQFVSEIIHFDTPWYVGRIEQRIGRIDRLGREKVRDDALSTVIFNEDSVEAGLFHCYNEGFQVYTKSISGLEFALRDVEKEIATLAVNGGRDRLVGYVAKLAIIAEQERAQNESEALSDLASFDRSAAERFQRVLQSGESEQMLERSFVEYFNMIATKRSVVEVGDQLHPQGIWQFTLDNTLYGILPLHEKDNDDLFGTCKGTFRRDLARQTPQLDFFNIGNPFFDAVISSLKLHSTGRVYAIDCKIATPGKWGGFEFVFSIALDLDDTPENWGLANQARSIFTVMPVHLFFRLDGKAEPSDALLKVRQSLQHYDKDRTWWNLTKERTSLLLNLAQDGDWQSILYNAHEEAQKKARVHFESRLGNEIATELRRLAEIRRNLEKQTGNQGKEEIGSIERLTKVLESWRVELDSVGFLGINLGLNGA